MSFQHEHDLDELAAEGLEIESKDRRRHADPLVCDDAACVAGAGLCDRCRALVDRYGEPGRAE